MDTIIGLAPLPFKVPRLDAYRGTATGQYQISQTLMRTLFRVRTMPHWCAPAWALPVAWT